MKLSPRMVLIGSASMLAATTGMAQAAQPTFYAGGDIVQVTSKVDDKTGVPPIVTGSADAISLRVKGGAHILDWLDAEAHLVLPQSETYSTAGRTNTVETAIFAVFAKPNINAGPVNIYALFGLAQTNFKLSGVVDGSQSASGLAFGVGAQYAITRNVSVSIDYTQYPKKNFELGGFSGGIDLSASVIGLGATYTFK